MKLRYVGNAPYFGALSEQEQERVSERMHLERRRSGEMLFRKGDASSVLYLIKSGWVRLAANGGPGLANQGPGSLVGETDLFLDQPRSLGALTATDAELWALSKDDLVDLISKEPQIGIKLSIAFGSRLVLFDQYLVEKRLQSLPLLASLDKRALLVIAGRLTPIEKQKAEMIVEEGQASEALFIIESGQVHLHSADEGDEFTELGQGDSFGELAVLTGKAHGRSAQAATDVVLWALPAAEFNALTEEFPEIRLALSKTVREPLLSRDQSRAVERLATMPLFAGLPEDVLRAVSERLLLHHIPAGEMVFVEGSPGDALYLVDSGQVEIVSDGGAGPIVLARLGADEFFGEMALLTGKPRSTTARTATHTNLWVLYRSDFEELVNRYPAISLALSKVLSQRLAEADRRFTESHLRGLKLLAGLSPGQLEDVSSRLKPARYRQGEVIIREGDPGQEMFFIESGRARVVRGTGPRASLLAELGAGDLFGEMSLLTGAPRSATVTALSDVNLWILSQADFDALVTAYPHLSLALSRLLSERLRNTDERFVRQPATAIAVPVQPEPAAKPSPRPQPEPIPAPKPKRARRRPARKLTSELQETFEGAVTWFGSLSQGAKVRLVLITILLAWLFFVVAPALVISTLAAENVTNLQGAIAFVQTEPSFATETSIPTDTPIPVEQVVSAANEQEAVIVPEPAVEVPAGAPVEAPAEIPVEASSEAPVEADSLPPDEPASAPRAEPLPTATPWIIVITNTPEPPTDTPAPTDTPIPPTATPKSQRVASAAPEVVATPTPAERPQPPRDLDPRLSSLNVAIQPVGVRPGQSYWRLVAVRWENEQQAGGGHSIFVDVLDESASKIVGQPIEIRWVGGGLTVFTEQKPLNEYAANFPMYNTLGSYSVSIAGLPSDLIVGLGLGTAEQPGFKVHTNFFLTFQRVTR